MTKTAKTQSVNEVKNVEIVANENQSNSVAVKAEPKTAEKSEKSEKSVRLFETRDMWSMVFDHTAELLVKACNGEAVKPTDVSGFGFSPKVKVKDGKERKALSSEQPHIRLYLYSLLLGFVSRKATKLAKESPEIWSKINLEEVANKVLKGLWPKMDIEKAGKKDGVKAKQPKRLLAVVEAMLKGRSIEDAKVEVSNLYGFEF